VVGLAGLPLLAACSSSPPATPAPTTAPAGGAASTPAAAAATQGPAASSGQKMQLRILQWSHFVPAWDKWYDQFAKDWGAKNNVDVSVDHMPTAEMPARLAAEVAAKAGHDLIEMNGQILTYRYTDQMADVGDIVDYAVKKWGEVEPQVGGRAPLLHHDHPLRADRPVPGGGLRLAEGGNLGPVP
jgi:ABC-type glycerol-3-phosphate transport system substrate-binding protein